VFRTTLARAAPPVRLLAGLVVLIGLAFTATTLPGARGDHAGFWVPVDGWLQGSGYALIALLILLRPLLVREARTLWWLLAAAVTLRAVGYVVYFAWVRTQVPQPYPSAADPLWLGASLIFVVVIALRTRYFGRDLSRLLTLDGLIAGLTVAGLSVGLLRTTLVALTGPGVPDRAVAVSVIYPILDVVALVLIAGLCASGWRPSRAEAMVATGVALFALVESVYLYRLATNTFRPGTLLSALSYLATLMVALAAWLPGPSARPVPAPAPAASVALPPRAPVAVPAGLALASLAGLLVMAYTGEQPVLAVVLLMLGLVVTVVRGVLTLVQDREQADVIIASRTRDTAQFQSVVEASGDFVLIATLDGRVTFVNAAGREMIGLPSDRDLSTMTYDDFLTDASRRSFEEVERPAVMTSGHWEGQSELCNLGAGRPIPVTVASFLMRDPETQEPVALATVQRDTSELVDAERAMAGLAEHRRWLLSRLVQAQEDERARIAADVHDDSVQALAAVDLRLGQVRRRLAEADPATRASLERAHAAVHDATARLRHLLFDLDSPALRTDLATALREAATFVLEDAGLRWQVTGDTDLELSSAERVTAYRVAKEALVNVRKHAGATSVEIRLTGQDGGLLLTVTDDGRGVETATLRDRSGHIGLAGMRDRAEVAGGWLRIDSEPGRGTELQLWIPHQPAG
jgi:PAS domain S-box-containing protein